MAVRQQHPPSLPDMTLAGSTNPSGYGIVSEILSHEKSKEEKPQHTRQVVHEHIPKGRAHHAAHRLCELLG